MRWIEYDEIVERSLESANVSEEEAGGVLGAF